MKTLILSAFAVASLTSFAELPYGDGFATGKPEDYLELLQPDQNTITLKKMEGMTGKSCLRITGSTTAQFKMVNVDQKTKYTLTFRASFTGGESIEENPRLDVSVMPGYRLPILPSREIRFLDAEKKILSARIPRGMPFRLWHEYNDTFYPPPEAVFMRLYVRSAPGIALSLDNLNFKKTPDEGAINTNPEFKYGLYNYSGWDLVAKGGKLIELKDGEVAFDTKNGSAGSYFWVSEPGTYSLSGKVIANGRGSIRLRLYDGKGKETDSILLGKNPTYFVLPPGTMRGRFIIRRYVVQELRLTRIGDENKINELLEK